VRNLAVGSLMKTCDVFVAFIYEGKRAQQEKKGP
jgi:hypothetical protein